MSVVPPSVASQAAPNLPSQSRSSLIVRTGTRKIVSVRTVNMSDREWDGGGVSVAGVCGAVVGVKKI